MKSMFAVNSIRAAVLASLSLSAQLAFAIPVAPPVDLSKWTCTGVCGASAADGDIGLSPIANPLYGYVATSGSSALGVSPLALDSNSRGNGTETNGSKIVSNVFHGNAGEQLDLRFNYISTDGKGFDDYAWARLLNAADNSLVAWLFTARSSNSSTKNIVPGGVIAKKAFDPSAVIVDYADYNFHSKTTADPVNWSRLGFSNSTCWKDNAAGCGFTGWLHSQVSFADAGDYRVEFGVVNWGDGAFDSGLAFDFAGLTGPTAAVPEPATVLLMLLGMGAIGFAVRRRG
jgi:hypothetical protein